MTSARRSRVIGEASTRSTLFLRSALGMDGESGKATIGVLMRPPPSASNPRNLRACCPARPCSSALRGSVSAARFSFCDPGEIWLCRHCVRTSSAPVCAAADEPITLQQSRDASVPLDLMRLWLPEFFLDRPELLRSTARPAPPVWSSQSRRRKMLNDESSRLSKLSIRSLLPFCSSTAHGDWQVLRKNSNFTAKREGRDFTSCGKLAAVTTKREGHEFTRAA